MIMLCKIMHVVMVCCICGFQYPTDQRTIKSELEAHQELSQCMPPEQHYNDLAPRYQMHSIDPRMPTKHNMHTISIHATCALCGWNDKYHNKQQYLYNDSKESNLTNDYIRGSFNQVAALTTEAKNKP